ncbi:hypothetical protein AGRA3207_007607 [Actinomadura graeca]|uniref:Transposase n=1 Tax=Actinomadura graeca TaxID=2750812 RepID=A0ABX8R8C0_9ACTN|nr:hypothetical protein [Actinomadura graeca]QXJ26022.1 hypothetical protein AGRA3207_007607 [Actinomadura graeca]
MTSTAVKQETGHLGAAITVTRRFDVPTSRRRGWTVAASARAAGRASKWTDRQLIHGIR